MTLFKERGTGLMLPAVLLIFVLSNGLSVHALTGHPHPYGQCSYAHSLEPCQYWRDAHIKHYRVLLNWKDTETEKDNYHWGGWEGHILGMAINNAHAMGARRIHVDRDCPRPHGRQWADCP